MKLTAIWAKQYPAGRSHILTPTALISTNTDAIRSTEKNVAIAALAPMKIMATAPGAGSGCINGRCKKSESPLSSFNVHRAIRIFYVFYGNIILIAGKKCTQKFFVHFVIGY